MTTTNTTTSDLHPADPAIWKSIAGTSFQIPTVDSTVYYFPQGHIEQSSSPPFLSPLVSYHPLIPCRVLSLSFLSNPDTDEVFSKIRLLPLDPSRDPHVLPSNKKPPPYSGGDGDGDDEVFDRSCDPHVLSSNKTQTYGDDDDEDEVFDRSRDSHVSANKKQPYGDDDDEDEVSSFAKVLTPSDANNGGGFSVPRFCADSIFPPLDFTAEPPVQNIMVRDVRGAAWEFRHIYRGTPRRHLLTTGWSKFVNSKKLIAGDSVVFMRKRRSGELFVGVRRAVRSDTDCGGRWYCPVGSVEEGGGRTEGFSRNWRGRVSPESVAEASELAAQGMKFEVVYYPKAGWADFVVKAEIVEESLNMFWTVGMRVKMAMETEDSSRMTWFHGTVSSTLVPENGAWRGSPWRMLLVHFG